MKSSWKKIFMVSFDVLLAVYLVVAFTAFNKPDEKRNVCRKVVIGMEEAGGSGFIDAKEIKRRLEANGIYPAGKPMRYVDARKIEERLKMSPFVKTAECYKTQDGQVLINITQLMPVIRIKADNGDDYYVDDKNSVMPNSSYTSDLIIATGNINRTFATNYISPMGKALMSNDMWKNLVEQVHVLPNHGIEIVPRIGDHIVYIGRLPELDKGGDREKVVYEFIAKKMTRLEKFYKHGLSHAGWNKYSYINIEFDNQIICKKRPLEAGRDKLDAVPDKQAGPSATQGQGQSQGQGRDMAEPQKQQTEQKKKIS